MPPKQRQIRMESKSAQAAMQALETRSDEELMREQRFRSAAQAILGHRAAERYDAPRAREHFRAALAAARPQERLQLRRMAEASLALAERRPDDLKAAAERLGQAPPTGRQLFALRVLGLVSPGGNAPAWRKAAGVLLLIAAIIVAFAIAWGIVTLIALPFGGVDTGIAIFYGFVLLVVVLVGMFFLGRRRQAAARAKAAEQRRA